MTRIAELSTEELKVLIHETIEESIEGLFEEFVALASPNYLESIAQARDDYKSGRTKPFEEVFDA